MSKRILALLALLVSLVSLVKAQTDSIGTIIDEVVWVVGDEAILKSDIEALRIQGQQEGYQSSAHARNWRNTRRKHSARFALSCVIPIVSVRWYRACSRNSSKT